MLDDRVSLRPVHFWNRPRYDTMWWRLLTEPGSAYNFGPGKVLARREGPPRDTRVHRFFIYYGETRVGVADIHHDVPNRVCTLILGLLEDHRRKKIGSIASRLMVRKSFTELDARRVESSTLSSNTASLEMQDGMIEEGRLLQRVQIRGEAHDEVLFRLLRPEWERQLAERLERSGAPRKS
jgi:RimJ/RimL family protein N-acetyltransferase